MKSVIKAMSSFSEGLNQFQRNNAAMYTVVLIVVTAIVTAVVNSVAAKLQDDPPAIKGLDKVSGMIERMALDFYGKSDEESKQKVTEDVIAYLENRMRETYVTKDEFKRSQSYMTDPETGEITALRIKGDGIYAVSIDPKEFETNKLNSIQETSVDHDK